ncbi:MAG TPA: hypothetical protein VGD80_19005 [Kofleriaceae bacterium]
MVDRDTADHRECDPVVENEVALLERKGACRTLRHHAMAKLRDLLGRKPNGFSKDIDLVSIGRCGEPARDVGDLGGGDEVIGERDAGDRVGRQRRGRRDDRSVLERDAIALTFGLHRQLAGVTAQSNRSQGHTPGSIVHASPHLHHSTAATVCMPPFDGVFAPDAMRP